MVSFWNRLYSLRAKWEDRRIGRSSMETIKPSRFRAQGAEATQSSDYRCLDTLFRHLPLTAEDTLVDVGCGEGRVLTYLHLRHRCGRLIGAELDPEVAESARQRTAACPDIEILCGNILEQHELIQKATVFYLFNPFNGKIFSKFTAMLEQECVHPIRLGYLFDYYGDYLLNRPGWSRSWSDEIPRRGAEPAHASVYTFDPAVYAQAKRN